MKATPGKFLQVSMVQVTTSNLVDVLLVFDSHSLCTSLRLTKNAEKLMFIFEHYTSV